MRFWIQFKHKFMQGARNSWFDAGYEQLSKWLRRSCRSPFKLKIITPIVELMLRFRRDLMISTSGHRSGLCTEIIHWDGLVGWLLQHLHKASVHTRKTRKAACWPIWCFFFFFRINYISTFTFVYTSICTYYQHKSPWMHSTSQAFSRNMLPRWSRLGWIHEHPRTIG